tara:strand:+ start:181 stop:348 length:168 start_codon:yes stop_codon:yes gene_type:complete
MITNIKKQNLNGKLVSYEMTLSDGKIMSVPMDENNTDYQRIFKWEADGNTIEEAD